jgi:pimeloyl-ACP methyl ester carboxylesterase
MKKAPLIFIHGLRGDHYGLIEIADALRKDFDVITPDLPGYGEHVALKYQTLDSYADWLHEYIQELNLAKKPVLIGHSMGSMVTSYFQTKYPEDTDKRTVYLAPIVRTEKHQKRSNRVAKLLIGVLNLMSGRRRYRLLKSKFVAFIISRYLTYDHARQKFIDRQHFEHSGRFTSTKAVIGDIELSMREQTTLEAPKTTLLCMGNHDRLSKVKNVQERMKGHKNISLVVLEGTGHLLNYEQPEKCANTIRKFLNS